MAALFHGGVQVTGDLTGGGVLNATSGFSLGGTLFGFGSLSSNNVFLGFSGNAAITGKDNTANGSGALLVNTSGSFNTANGNLVLSHNTTGTQNTATGFEALLDNSIGSDNTADGSAALSSNTTGIDNTAVGALALAGSSTGGSNTAVGYQALLNNNTGTGNTALGFSAGPDSAHSNLTNATAIGTNALVTESNALVLGSTGVNVGIGISAPAFLLHIGVGNNGFRVEGPATPGTGFPAGSFGGYGDFGIDAPGIGNGRFVVKESGAVGVAVAAPTHIFQVGQGFGNAFADGWSTYSSRRWKTNIQTLPNALAKVEQLRGVSYDLKGNGKHEIGVIAEEVGAVVPEIVTYEQNGKDAQGVDYTRLTALLIEAVKQEQRQIQNQQQQIRTQQKQITRLTGKVEVLQTALGTTRQTKSKPTHLAQNESPKTNLP
jgi:hypothetical protein